MESLISSDVVDWELSESLRTESFCILRYLYFMVYLV